MDAHFAGTDANEFATSREVPREIKTPRVDKKQVSAEHEIERAVEKRQSRQGATDIAAVHEMRCIVRQKPLRGTAPIGLGGIDRRKRFETEETRLRAHLRKHAFVIK